MSVGPSAHLSADHLSCCLPTFISVCTFICLSADQLSCCLPTFISVYNLYLPVCGSVVFLPSYLCIPLSACLPTSVLLLSSYLPIYKYLYLPVCRSVVLSSYLRICVYLYLPVCRPVFCFLPSFISVVPLSAFLPISFS